MAVEQTLIRSHLVFRDNILTHRWFGVWGPAVVKYELNTAATPTDDTTGMPTEFTNTLVNGSTFAHTDVSGGAVLLTCDTAENDGIQLQLGDELGGVGENVNFAARYPTYFGTTFAVNDADQTDILLGFCITDTAAIVAVSDGMYFRSVDESALLYFVLEQDNVESATAVGTLTDGANVTAEFYYFGSNVYVYVNSVLMATIADSDANFPNDELLRLTIALLTGEAVANTLTISRLGFAQIQG